MNDDLEWRIRTFFDYWRQRHKFINNLDLSKHNHEANVLLWASIDALSNLWAKNIGKEQCHNKGIKGSKRLIFDAFLAHYGGEIFQIVSLPDLWSRIDFNQTDLKLPEDVCVFLGKIGERQTQGLLDYPHHEDSDDLILNEIINKTLNDYPTTDRAQLEKSLTLSRYGAIAYKEMRTAYIHEGRSGNDAHLYELNTPPTKPIYYTGKHITPPTIGFSVRFMLHVLENCINAFEAEALTLQQDPVPSVPTT
jgi:hypothetical protein